jgi:MoxR-like ATPase
MYKKLNDNFENIKINKILNKKEIKKIQNILKDIYVSDNIYEYVADIIESTRNPKKYNLENISSYLSYGISPRG